MTIEEIKKRLESFIEIFNICKEHDNSFVDVSIGKEDMQAFAQAVKNLEAWEKVRDEIKQKSDYTKNIWDEYPDEWYAGKCNAYGECLRIIDKHLAEVTK